jgi:serine/threonine-protein kinase RsbW
MRRTCLPVSFAGKSKRTIDVTPDLPTVRLELISRPEAPALVRAALAGVGELLEFEPELLDDLKTAVSEACNNVVLHAYRAEPGPLVVGLAIDAEAIEVVVRDRGSGFGRVTTSEDRMGVGLAVINALADRAEFISAQEGGTEVRMEFAGRRMGRPLPARATDPEPVPELAVPVSGDVVVDLASVGLLSSVLGRLARAVASSARFSLDRFSDLYLLADAISAHARAAAANARISFAIKAQDRRLELTAGPFRAGSGALLEGDTASGRPRSLLAMLADELAVERAGAVELLHVVVADRSRDPISQNG